MMSLHNLRIVFAFLALFSAVRGQQISQMHIAQLESYEAMTVVWASSTLAAPGTDCFVSTTPGGSADAAHFTGTSTQYTYNYPGRANYTSPLLHFAVLNQLKPRTLYFYRCGDKQRDVFSPWRNFTTMPAKGDASPLSFAVIGDLGMTVDSKATIAHIANNPSLGMILHAGDLSYANGYATQWDEYGNMTEFLASARPWQVCAGNHEIEYVPNMGLDGSALYAAYEARYKMSDTVAELGPITWMDQSYKGCCPSSFQSVYNYGSSFYSFDAGLSHIIFANPYTASDVNSEQYKFIEKDLASLDRTLTPFVFLINHSPWYNSNTAHENEISTTMTRNHLEPLLFQHNVAAVFAGHVHACTSHPTPPFYLPPTLNFNTLCNVSLCSLFQSDERSYPAYKNLTNPKGVVYVTIGDAGNAEGHATHYIQPTPVWSAFRNGTQYGHGQLTVENATHALWTWYRNIDGEYVNKDSYMIVNPFTAMPTAAAVSVPPTAAPTPGPVQGNLLQSLGKDAASLSDGGVIGIFVSAIALLLLTGALVYRSMAGGSKALANQEERDVKDEIPSATSGPRLSTSGEPPIFLAATSPRLNPAAEVV